MQGGALSSWEKMYWGVFVVAISVFLFNRAGHFTSSEKDDDAEAEAKELEKQKRARLILAGASMLDDDDDDDPFEGLTPKVRMMHTGEGVFTYFEQLHIP